MNEKKAAAQRQGFIVFIVLAILTAIEFWVSVSLDGSIVPIILINLLKAGLIVQYFMHIYRLWREEDHS